MGDDALARNLRQALPAGWSLRERVDGDLPFLAALYAQTREEELRPVAWSPEQKLAFLADQFAKQHAYYLQHYPHARWWVLTCEGERAGRLYVSRTSSDLRVMDITVAPQHRNRGVGTALLRVLVDETARAGIECSLHVEPYNPALRLYTRLGFQFVEVRGAYHYMRRASSVHDDFVLRGDGVARDGHHEKLERPVRRVHNPVDGLRQHRFDGPGQHEREGLGAARGATQVAQLDDGNREGSA